MKKSFTWLIIASCLAWLGSISLPAQERPKQDLGALAEAHLKNVTQLTVGGQNAEAYFSYDGSKIIFQSTRPPYQCDQIFSMNLDGSEVKLLNNGRGRSTCGFLFPDGKRFLYASTYLMGDPCPLHRIAARAMSGRFIRLTKFSARILTAQE